MENVRDGERIVIYLDGEILARNVIYCESSDLRREGLLGRRKLEEDDGIVMKMPGSRGGKSGFITSIHMIGMKFPVAAVWLDYTGAIVHSALAKPWRPYYGSPEPAWYVLETHPNHLEKLKIGKKVSWKLVSGEVLD